MTCKSGLIASICAKEGDIIGRIVVIEFNNEEQSPFDEVMEIFSRYSIFQKIEIRDRNPVITAERYTAKISRCFLLEKSLMFFILW